MATCPRCMGALTEHHRCPKRLLSRITEALSTVGVGALAGVVVCLIAEDSPPGALVVAAAVLGGVLASAVRQALRP